MTKQWRGADLERRLNYERRQCSRGDHVPIDFAVGTPCVCGAKKIGPRDTSHDADPRAAKDNPLSWVSA